MESTYQWERHINGKGISMGTSYQWECMGRSYQWEGHINGKVISIGTSYPWRDHDHKLVKSESHLKSQFLSKFFN